MARVSICAWLCLWVCSWHLNSHQSEGSFCRIAGDRGTLIVFLGARFIWSLKNLCVTHFVCARSVFGDGCVWAKNWLSPCEPFNTTIICRSIVLHNVHSCRRREHFKAGRGVWVCNAIKWVLLLVWSASFHLVLLIWKRNQIRRSHHVFSHQKWWMTMFPLCFLFISSLRLLRAAVIRSSPALYTMSHCGEKQP